MEWKGNQIFGEPFGSGSACRSNDRGNIQRHKRVRRCYRVHGEADRKSAARCCREKPLGLIAHKESQGKSAAESGKGEQGSFEACRKAFGIIFDGTFRQLPRDRKRQAVCGRSITFLNKADEESVKSGCCQGSRDKRGRDRICRGA